MRIEEELLTCWQVRKNKKQKEAFRAFVLERCQKLGVPAVVEGRGSACNIVIGDAAHARVLFTAHYDTCAVMLVPNFVTPMNVPVYLLYSLLLSVGMIVVSLALGWVVSAVSCGVCRMGLCTLVFLWAQLLLMMIGPASRHTANDNTSGVALVLRLALCLPKNLRDKAAFVLFDGEELGFVGSTAFAKRHKQASRETLTINFDCIGDGEGLFVYPTREARRDAHYAKWLDAVERACETHGKQLLAPRAGRAFYPSDQAKFKKGVGVAALRRSRIVGWYTDKIHTRRDRVLEQSNLDALFAAAEQLLQDEAEN